MATLLMVILALTIMIYVILRIKIYIEVAYKRDMADDLLTVDVSIMKKFIAYHMEVPVIRFFNQDGVPWTEAKLSTEGGDLAPHIEREERYVKNISKDFLYHPSEWQSIKQELVEFSWWYRKVVRCINRRLVCERLSWYTRFGTEDAATTGIIVGLFWLLKSEGLIYLQQKFPFEAPAVLKVEPNYTVPGLEVDFRCIFSIRLGNLINAALSLLNVPGKVVSDSG